MIILFCSRVCGNVHGLVRKYNIMCCRQCFRIYSKDIGFVKVNSRENSQIPRDFILLREIISTIWGVIEVLSPMICLSDYLYCAFIFFSLSGLTNVRSFVRGGDSPINLKGISRNRGNGYSKGGIGISKFSHNLYLINKS